MNINISSRQLKILGMALASAGLATINQLRRRAMEPMIIIGITGTLGAGKGTVVEYLKKHHNCTFIYLSTHTHTHKHISSDLK